MANRKFTTMVTPNTLETMIEYTLISSILDRIGEMIKTPLEYPRYSHLVEPPQVVAKNQNMGIIMEKTINKTNEWTTWQWANVKINKESFTLFKQM
jgi:hypothetical protein